MSTGGYALPSARTILSNVVAVGGPALVGSLAYVADVVAPEYAAAGGAVGMALGALWVNCPRRPKVYAIRGTVKASPNALNNLTVQYSGTSSGTVLVGPDGKYEIPGLAPDSDYTVKVADVPFHTSTPADYKLVKLGADRNNADFAVAHNKVTLNGRIKPAGQETAGKIKVQYGEKSVTTKADGSFTIPDLLENEPYVIKPVCPAHHTLNLAEIRIDRLSGKSRADFTLTRTRYSISGLVTAKPQDLAAGVDIYYDSDPDVAPVTTGPDGRYTIPNLPAGEKYTVRPLKMHYPAEPGERAVPSLTQNTVLDFTIKLAQYTIAGVVNEVNQKGEVERPMDGVKVTLAGGAQPDEMTTGDSGKFTFTVPALANCTLSYAKSKVDFEPASPASFSPLLCDKTLDITGFDTSWLEVGQKVKPPRQPRWYDDLPRRSGGVGDWNAYESIASGYGAHTSDHLPGLIKAVGKGDFGRADVLPRIVAHAIQSTKPFWVTAVSHHYRISTLPNALGPPIVLASAIIVVHNFIANPLNTSCGTVYAR